MAKKTKNDKAQYVRKETFWLATLLALALGFFGGVMFAVLKSDSGAAPGRPQAQASQAQVATPARPNMIASLEDETAKNPQNTKHGFSWETNILMPVNTKRRSGLTGRLWS